MRLAAVAVVALLAVGLVPTGASARPSTGSPSPSPSPSSSSSTTESGQSSSKNVTFGAGPAGPERTKKGKVVESHGKIQYNVDGRSYFSYQAQPGSKLEDHIAILNFAYRPQKLAVYAVDATTDTSGDFAYQPRAAPRRLAGAWVSVGTPSASGFITVGPRSRTILPVHVQLPPNAPPGDHAAAIIVSLTGVIKGHGHRVNFEQRVATRLLVRVSGTLNPQLSIENLKAHFNAKVSPLAKGSVTVTYDVVNTGNAFLGAAQQVTIHGLFGGSASATSVPAVPLLLPGAHFPVKVRVSNVYPEVLDSAKVRIVPEGLQGDVNPGVHVTSASVHVWAIPWLLLIVILLVIGYVAYRIGRRRRRRKRGTGDSRTSTTAPQGASA
jgi:hypothetical protein